jgi:hypothetical protein
VAITANSEVFGDPFGVEVEAGGGERAEEERGEVGEEAEAEEAGVEELHREWWEVAARTHAGEEEPTGGGGGGGVDGARHRRHTKRRSELFCK